MQPTRRETHHVRWVAASLAAAVLALGVALASRTASGTSGAPSGQTSVTVISTSSPGPVPVFLAGEPDSAANMAGYRLVFDDEFSASKVSETLWETALPWGNTNRAEQQYYTPSALSQSGGILTITASGQPTGGKAYASGVISSHQSCRFTYGYVETRAQVPAGNGLWSAFWLVTPVAGRTEEADVMEVLGSDTSRGYAVLHHGAMADKKTSTQPYLGADLSAGFHTYALDWEPSYMVWYVDGVERYRITHNVPAGPMYLIANLSVGGPDSWSGAPDASTPLPARLKIDYIRVFQHK